MTRSVPFLAEAKRAVRSVVHAFGFDLVRTVPAGRLGVIAAEEISLVLDVGANAGEYVRTLRARGYAGRAVSFEPVPEAFARLAAATVADPAWEARQTAIGDADGEASLRVGADDRVSSLLDLDDAHLAHNPGWAVSGTLTVPTARLDSLAPEFVRPDDRVFLKVDVQGAELAVLRGAEATLSRVRALEIELSLAPVYVGQPLAPELLQRLYGSGFRLVALERAFVDPVTQYLVQVDGIFIRDDDPT